MLLSLLLNPWSRAVVAALFVKGIVCHFGEMELCSDNILKFIHQISGYSKHISLAKRENTLKGELFFFFFFSF